MGETEQRGVDADLDARLRAHYAALRPDEATVAGLAAMARRPSRARRPIVWAVAASVLVLSSVTVHLTSSIGERTERTVREAAMNHNTRLALEFPAESLTSLNETMALLPFELRRPERVSPEWTPIGGRYCSIAGHLAAHVKLARPGGGETLSLFVTRDADDLEHLDGHHRGIDGVDVELWDENGLFYAMARGAS